MRACSTDSCSAAPVHGSAMPTEILLGIVLIISKWKATESSADATSLKQDKNAKEVAVQIAEPRQSLIFAKYQILENRFLLVQQSQFLISDIVPFQIEIL
jgi:hypothetical protein